VALMVLYVPKRSISMTVLKARGERPEMGARLWNQRPWSVREVITRPRSSTARGDDRLTSYPRRHK
jgi:hypothetical protein